jgi:hypothetical protein
MRRLLLVVAVLVPFAVATTVNAATFPFPVKSASPSDGATVAPQNEVTFVVKTDQEIPSSAARLQVNSQPTLGQDGTLASEFIIDLRYPSRGDAFPDTYTASTVPNTPWTQTPGTYYWQMYYSQTTYPGGVAQHDTHTSPVYTLVVAAPPAPPPPPVATPRVVPPVAMTKAQALSYLRPVLRKMTRHSVFRLRRQCDRVDSETFNCAVHWWTSKRRARGTYYVGDIELTDAGARIRYKFSGRKATAKCIKRRSFKRCLRRVR